MKRLKMAARFIALLCYFAPFETCNSFGSGTTTMVSTTDSVARNDQSFVDTIRAADTSKDVAVTDSTRFDSTKSEKAEIEKDSFWEKIYYRAIYPTDDSISGIGVITQFEIETGLIAIDISFLLTVFLLFSWKFLRIKKRRQHLLLVNLLCIVVFIVDGLTTKDVELRWGVWCLTGVVIFQLFLENYSRRKTAIDI